MASTAAVYTTDRETTMESVTTDVMEETTALPEAVTTATTLPEETTAFPEATTALPEATTALPEAITTLPEATTALPEATTALPEATTALPEATTLPALTTAPLPPTTVETTPPEMTTTTTLPTTTPPPLPETTPAVPTSSPAGDISTMEVTSLPPDDVTTGMPGGIPSNSLALIVGFSVAGVVIIAVIVLVCVLVKRSRKKKQRREAYIEQQREITELQVKEGTAATQLPPDLKPGTTYFEEGLINAEPDTPTEDKTDALLNGPGPQGSSGGIDNGTYVGSVSPDQNGSSQGSELLREKGPKSGQFGARALLAESRSSVGPVFLDEDGEMQNAFDNIHTAGSTFKTY